LQAKHPHDRFSPWCYNFDKQRKIFSVKSVLGIKNVRKAKFLGLLILLIVGVSCTIVEPRLPPEAPRGTPLRVNAHAVYVDDSGRTIRQGEELMHVAGVKISVFGARGQTKITTEQDIDFIMLAGYNYTIKATFNESTQSIRVVVEGDLASKEEIDCGGYIGIRVYQSSNTIKSITYQRPAYE